MLVLGLQGKQFHKLPLEKAVRMPQYSRLIPLFEHATSAPVERIIFRRVDC